MVTGGREAQGDLTQFLQAILAAGVDIIQLREKDAEAGDLLHWAEVFRRAAERHDALFVVNDRPDVALACGADGVHVGQDDMAVEDARRLLGRGAILGLSIKTVAEAEAAPLELLDYVGIGGIFETSSKHNPDPPIGPDGLARIAASLRRRAARFPLCAIAGIDASNAAAAIAAGADGVAVISALSLARDPQAAAQALRGAVDEALARREGRGRR